MASVKENGPFSLFPGYYRSLAILNGEGLRIRVGNRDWCTLLHDSPPLQFSGDENTEANLIKDEVADFNVFTKNQFYSHTTQRISLPPQSSHQIPISPLNTTILCPFIGSIEILEKKIVIEDGDSCVCEKHVGFLTVVANSPKLVDLFVVQIHQKA